MYTNETSEKMLEALKWACDNICEYVTCNGCKVFYAIEEV